MNEICIAHVHFVKVQQMTDAMLAWLSSDECFGFVVDDGSWRDYAIREVRGVEFEHKRSAIEFVEKFGGEYYQRKENQ